MKRTTARKKTMDEFIHYVESHIFSYLPEEMRNRKIRIDHVSKLEREYTGMILEPKEKAEQFVPLPTVNLDQMYAVYQKGVSLEQILRDIAEILQAEPPKTNYDWVMDYQQVKDKLIVRLNNFEKNKDILEDLPYLPMEDLAMTVHIAVPFSGGGFYTTPVTKSLLQEYGITEEELFADATNSCMHLLPIRIISLREMAEEWLRVHEEFDEEKAFPEMFILTNDQKVNGASAILYPHVMECFAKGLDSNIIILPSSIHEVILLAFQADSDVEYLRRIVYETNRKFVGTGEFLSDEAYLYEKDTGKIRILK